MTTKAYAERLRKLEDEIRQVHKNPSAFTLEECRDCDLYIKRYALKNFERHLSTLPPWAAKVLRPWAECHFGSTEVDQLMMELNCYPEWIKERQP